jgi:hypothetical protein
VKNLWEDAASLPYSIEMSQDGVLALRAAREQRAQIEMPHPAPLPVAAIVAAPAGDVRLGRLQTEGVPIAQLENWSGASAHVGHEDMLDLMAPLRELRERVRSHDIERGRLEEIGRIKARAEFEPSRQGEPRVQLRLVPSSGLDTSSRQTTPISNAAQPVSTPAKGWWAIAGRHIVEKQRTGRFATAKELYRALEADVGSPASPFVLGEGIHRGELIVAQINQPLALKTVQNNWAKIKSASN